MSEILTIHKYSVEKAWKSKNCIKLFAFRFKINLIHKFLYSLQEVFSSLFEKLIYSLTNHIEDNYFWVSDIYIFCYVICALVDFIKYKSYIMIDRVFLDLHLLLKLRLDLKIVILYNELTFLLSLVFKFTCISNHFEESLVINLTSVVHVIDFNHGVFDLLLFRLRSIIYNINLFYHFFRRT